MKKLFAMIVGVCVVFSALSAVADTLELKNGSVIKGTFVGGSESQVSFRVGSTVQHYAVADITTLKFDSDSGRSAIDDGFAPRPRPEPKYAEPAPVTAVVPVRSAPIPPTAGDRISVPTGTRLTIRTV